MAEKQVRILVVDDEESVRNLLQRILAEAGYNVTTAADGDEALYEMSRREIEVALIDIRMPGMSGIELLGKLVADWPDTGVLMVSAVVDTKTAVEAMKIGAHDYITKPFDRNDVARKVQQSIEKRERQLRDKHHYLQLKDKFSDQTQRMQEQFTELVNSLAREHKLLHKLAARQVKGGETKLPELPRELQEPINSLEEFRDALIRILKKG